MAGDKEDLIKQIKQQWVDFSNKKANMSTMNKDGAWQATSQGGLWEFPGGKVEVDETIQQALVRELKEELDIIAECFEPLVVIEHDYGDKIVRLDVWLVTQFDGVPVGCEGQQVKWSTIDELTRYEFPAANKKIIEKIFSLRAAGLTSDV